MELVTSLQKMKCEQRACQIRDLQALGLQVLLSPELDLRPVAQPPWGMQDRPVHSFMTGDTFPGPTLSSLPPFQSVELGRECCPPEIRIVSLEPSWALTSLALDIILPLMQHKFGASSHRR